MANERALGLAFIYAVQTWRQLVICYGEDEARAMFGLTNNLVVFGGGKDGVFYQEVSDLLGTTRVSRRSYNLHRGGWGSSFYGDDVPVLRPEEIRRLPERHALVVAENARPFVARLSRCIDGSRGEALLRAQAEARSAGRAGTAVSVDGPMASPFPAPPGVVATVLDELRLAAASATDESEHESRRVAVMHRPWDPASCPPELRRNVYAWLDKVVGWINEEHTWRTDRIIPICWDLHPHIVHELATVTCLRWEVTFARTAGPLAEWHRSTLPEFLQRVVNRIGETGCPPGRHQPSPGAGRNAIYRDGDEVARRRRRRWQEG